MTLTNTNSPYFMSQCRGNHSHFAGHGYNLRAIMLDTQGPEIRTGSFSDGAKKHFNIGDIVSTTFYHLISISIYYHKQ